MVKAQHDLVSECLSSPSVVTFYYENFSHRQQNGKKCLQRLPIDRPPQFHLEHFTLVLSCICPFIHPSIPAWVSPGCGTFQSKLRAVVSFSSPLPLIPYILATGSFLVFESVRPFHISGLCAYCLLYLKCLWLLLIPDLFFSSQLKTFSEELPLVPQTKLDPPSCHIYDLKVSCAFSITYHNWYLYIYLQKYLMSTSCTRLMSCLYWTMLDHFHRKSTSIY